MTERQQLIAHKQTLQFAKNKLKQIEGIEVLKIFEQDEHTELNKMYLAYVPSYSYDYNMQPCSKLPYKSTESQIHSWIIANMGLKEKNEYFFYCRVWVKIKILDLQLAVQSLWKQSTNIGFLLAEIDLSYMLEVSFDSRDEDNYLIDIWKYNK